MQNFEAPAFARVDIPQLLIDSRLQNGPDIPMLTNRLLACVLLVVSASPAIAAVSPGLTVGPDGTVLKEGRPYRGVGINYFDPFIRTIHQPTNTSFDDGFRVLAKYKIPFARFAATGFWPRDMQLYLTNRAEYFRRMDSVVRSAERHGVGLIPSLFWHYSTLPDMAGEPMDQWGNPQSRTHQLMREYVKEVVGRYKDSPAIWAWEFGNEFNLVCDLPNAAQHRPPVHPRLGTPASRSERDELTYEQAAVALREFGREVRKLDPHRLISSGHSIPRPSAWHNWKEKNWKLDSPTKMLQMFSLTHPEPIDLVSIHCYEEAINRMPGCVQAASEMRKPLFIGEFQVAKDGRKELAEFLESLDQQKVPLAAIWVFDLKSQEADFSISETNARSWQLAALREWNERQDLSLDITTQFLVLNLSHTGAPEAMRTIAKEFRNSAKEVEEFAKLQVRPGVAAIFSYLAHDRSAVERRLSEFLVTSVETDLPVVVQLDGENWWQGRPDLWNWWDPTKPGYSPSNRFNVEWTGWSPDEAIKIAWRNWGRQLRVLPPPNLMSPAYRAACHEEMRHFVPIVLEWWRGLPTHKKDLLIGIKLGWESSIGVNAWYYPNGNDLLDRPASEDPTHGLKAEDVPARGVTQIGYAAVKTAGLRSSGEVTEADLAEVTRRHLEDLCRLASELGVPRERLFTHGAGWKDEELLYGAAVNEYSCPGWSFYRYAAHPEKDAGVQAGLKASDAPYWAAVEWLFQGPDEGETWRAALERTLAMPRCRYVCIYNWEGIRGKKGAMEGIRRVVGE